MVKKTVIAIIGVVLLVAVFAGAANRWGYSQYGAVYYYGYPSQYAYVPLHQEGPTTYYPWAYLPQNWQLYYDSPLGAEYIYRYGTPRPLTTDYPTQIIQRGGEGQLCGILNNAQTGCLYGLVCDYTKTNIPSVGVCARQSDTTTYPYQLPPSTTYPYYWG